MAPPLPVGHTGPVDPPLTEVADRLRRERGWELLDDVTTQCPTAGTPVHRVLTEHGEASLRVGLRPEQVAAYRVMQHSGVTPLVHDHGVSLPRVPWVLLEWVPGHALARLDEDLTPEQVLGWTPEVFAAAQRLYGVQRAPATAHEQALHRAHEAEWVAVRELDLTSSTPPLISITAAGWEPSVLLHGHLWPSNALRTTGGGLRLVDLDGGFGPPERDAGRWVGGLCALTLPDTTSMADLQERTESFLAQVSADAPFLHRARLRAWTAVALVEHSLALRERGGDLAQARALVALGGRLHSLRTVAGDTAPQDALSLDTRCQCGSRRRFRACCGAYLARAVSRAPTGPLTQAPRSRRARWAR